MFRIIFAVSFLSLSTLAETNFELRISELDRKIMSFVQAGVYSANSKKKKLDEIHGLNQNFGDLQVQINKVDPKGENKKLELGLNLLAVQVGYLQILAAAVEHNFDAESCLSARFSFNHGEALLPDFKDKLNAILTANKCAQEPESTDK